MKNKITFYSNNRLKAEYIDGIKIHHYPVYMSFTVSGTTYQLPCKVIKFKLSVNECRILSNESIYEKNPSDHHKIVMNFERSVIRSVFNRNFKDKVFDWDTFRKEYQELALTGSFSEPLKVVLECMHKIIHAGHVRRKYNIDSVEVGSLNILEESLREIINNDW